MTSRTRRLHALVSVGAILSAFAACVGDTPESSTGLGDAGTATASSSSSSGTAPTGDGAPSDAASFSSSGASGDGGDADASADSGPVCTEGPVLGARVVASCLGVLQLVLGGLPDAGDYELAHVTGQGNGTCAQNTVQDKPWKGAARVLTTSATEREVHLRLLPPSEAGEDGASEVAYHLRLTTSEAGKEMHALCNSPLPVYIQADAGDRTTAPASFGQLALADGGIAPFLLQMQAHVGAERGPSAVFRFERLP